MQFQSSLLALASILHLALGAPAGINTDSLTRSQKALLDSSKLICGQYAGSEWVMIGPLKVPCDSPLLAIRDESTDLDTNWQHEYAKKRDEITDLDTNWQHEYAKKRHEGIEDDGVDVKRDEITDLDTNWQHEPFLAFASYECERRPCTSDCLLTPNQAMPSNDEVEAIASDPNFEIITTFAFSAGLPHNETSLSGSHCYLLQHGIDRLQAAASDFTWTAVAEDLRCIDRVQVLSKEVDAHMLSTHGEASKDPGRRFIVRLALKRDGILSIMSGPRPNSTDPLYPITFSDIMNPLRISKIPVYLDTELTTPSLFTKHKTTHRQPYNAAWKRLGMDETTSPAECDVLLQNENGHIMGAAFRTVYFWRDGRLVTPSSVTGCKMGVSRRWALDNAGVKETLITAMDISDGEEVWLSSAVGGFIQGKVTLGRKPQNE